MLFGSIVTAKKLGECQEEPQWLFPFYYFLKSNFDLSSPGRKKFTKYTSVGVCVDSSIYLVSDLGEVFIFPSSLPSASAHGSLKSVGSRQRSRNFLEKVGQLLFLSHLPCDYKRLKTVLSR